MMDEFKPVSAIKKLIAERIRDKMTDSDSPIDEERYEIYYTSPLDFAEIALNTMKEFNMNKEELLEKIRFMIEKEYDDLSLIRDQDSFAAGYSRGFIHALKEIRSIINGEEA